MEEESPDDTEVAEDGLLAGRQTGRRRGRAPGSLPPQRFFHTAVARRDVGCGALQEAGVKRGGVDLAHTATWRFS